MLHPIPCTIPQEVVIFLNFECSLMFVCLFLQVFNANFGLFRLKYFNALQIPLAINNIEQTLQVS